MGTRVWPVAEEALPALLCLKCFFCNKPARTIEDTQDGAEDKSGYHAPEKRIQNSLSQAPAKQAVVGVSAIPLLLA